VRENVPTFPCPSEMYVLTYTFSNSSSLPHVKISSSARIAENIKNEKENFCKILPTPTLYVLWAVSLCIREREYIQGMKENTL
jgi:hypothetical protein